MAGGLEDSGKNSPFKMAGGLEDWRIQEKNSTFKMTGGLEDWRIQEYFRRENNPF